MEKQIHAAKDQGSVRECLEKELFSTSFQQQSHSNKEISNARAGKARFSVKQY